MKSKPYWLNRAIDRQSTIDKLSQAELNEIKKIYDNAERDFVKMINEIYESYSKQTGLDVSELKKLMSFNETDKFWKSMEGKNMKQYVMKNYKARITRLEALQAQLQMKCNDIANRQAHIMNVAGKSAVKFSFSKTVYDTSIGVNTDLSFATLDERTIDLILKEKWLGSNYSERVWKNTDLLAKNLQNILTKAVMTGASYSRTTMELRDKMGSSWSAAERLVRTEMNHFHNQAELQAYEEMGVEQYVFVATLDNRTSQICQELDGKKFKLSEAKEGVNYPPMHPYCRSTVRAFISDDVEKSLKRRARDENGKNTVVDNMSYSEWMDNRKKQIDPIAYKESVVAKPYSTFEEDVKKNWDTLKEIKKDEEKSKVIDLLSSLGFEDSYEVCKIDEKLVKGSNNVLLTKSNLAYLLLRHGKEYDGAQTLLDIKDVLLTGSPYTGKSGKEGDLIFIKSYTGKDGRLRCNEIKMNRRNNLSDEYIVHYLQAKEGKANKLINKYEKLNKIK